MNKLVNIELFFGIGALVHLFPHSVCNSPSIFLQIFNTSQIHLFFKLHSRNYIIPFLLFCYFCALPFQKWFLFRLNWRSTDFRLHHSPGFLSFKIPRGLLFSLKKRCTNRCYSLCQLSFLTQSFFLKFQVFSFPNLDFITLLLEHSGSLFILFFGETQFFCHLKLLVFDRHDLVIHFINFWDIADFLL